MLYVVSIFPIILYLLLVKALDGFSLTGWRPTLLCLGWGVVSCALGYLVTGVCEQDLGVFLPLFEEFIKFAPLLVLIVMRKAAFFAEVLIYGAAIASGFAIPENMLYVASAPEFGIGDALVRGFGTALMHMGCTALCANLALMMMRLMEKWPTVARAAVSLLCLLPSSLIHYVYNLSLLAPMIQMVLVIVVMLPLFMLIYEIDGRLIHRWLDMCISNDVALFSAIRKGELKTTTAGEYLLKAKEKFAPEVFFDICVYLGLYLEVSIDAKSHMIMRDAGMDIPLTEEQKLRNREKIRELGNLRKSIGRAGLLFLSPIVDMKTTDSWAIDELI